MATAPPVPFVRVPGVPTDSQFQDAVLGTTYAVPALPSDGTPTYDPTTGEIYVRRNGVWGPAGSGRSRLVAPTDGVVCESISRAGTLSDLGATGLFGGATGGTINVVLLPLKPGDIVNALSFAAGATAANGPTHQWAGVADSNLKVLAVSVDGTNTAVAANAEVTFTMATPIQVPSVQAYYAFVMYTASTAVPSFVGATHAVVGVSQLAPKWAATSSTGQTTPPLVGATLGALTAVVLAPYVAVK